jgi:alginate O-acetyltransferase complex protein AlgI
VFFRAPTIRRAGEMLAAVAAGGGWPDAAPLVERNLFVVVLMLMFFVAHRFDDHRRIRIAARSLRPEILWPTLALLWIIAITVSQGSSAKFIYFDF